MSGAGNAAGNAPGTQLAANTTSWLCDLHVVYTKTQFHQPTDCVKDVVEQHSNINDGFDGYCVWLLPVFTTDPTFASIELKVDIQCEPNSMFQNIVEGAKGGYRYIRSINDPNGRASKIKEVALYRSSTSIDGTPQGWDGCTSNINSGRGGGKLYIVWKKA